MTTEPSVSEDGRLLPRLQPVYPLAIPCQRTGYSDTYPPVQDDLGKEKGGRLPGDRAAPRREAERLHLTSTSLSSISDIFVHHTGIAGSGFRNLEEGERGSYEPVRGRKGEQAENVRTV
jgi:cold shock CspA family protein